MLALTNIPANVVAGQGEDGQEQFIADLLALRPQGQRWAILLNTSGVSRKAPAFLLENDVGTVNVAQGCVCCSAQLEMRVALNRLLKQMQPHRVLIGVSGVAKLGEVLRLLSDRWLAPVLDLRATLSVQDATRLAGVSERLDDLEQERLALCDVIAIRGSGAMSAAAVDRVERVLAAGAPEAAMVHIDREPVLLAHLDRSSRGRPRSIFWRDDDGEK